MLAFIDTPVTKQEVLSQLQAHYDADEIVQGQYWENGKGCAVGCTIHGSAHAKYEEKFGIPRVLAKLEDSIFEGLTNGKAKEWPLRFMRAVQEGADLSMVWPKFAVWLLREKLPKATSNERSLKAIDGVAELYEEWLKTETKPAVSRWKAAAAAAAAADAAAAAYAAATAAYAAAYAAYAAAAADAAKIKFWEQAANKLEALISECATTGI